MCLRLRNAGQGFLGCRPLNSIGLRESTKGHDGQHCEVAYSTGQAIGASCPRLCRAVALVAWRHVQLS